jgi:GNAT superfamily N-acetyltransferase
MSVRIDVVDEAVTRELRRRVLRPHLPPGAPLPGDDLRHGVHLAAVDDAGTALCTCFVYADPCPWLPQRSAWRLRQMATDERHRGEGLGAEVVELAARYAAAQGAQVLWCNARETAAGFYERVGFARHGAVFTDEHHPSPHVRMWRELSGDAVSSTTARGSAGA